ncbi:MAG: hypothetical protein PWQ58_766, partial [Archaeoglobaceae archaeon]|nr:hypothetical protein [Archaeoglobaceae archaeon]
MRVWIILLLLLATAAASELGNVSIDGESLAILKDCWIELDGGKEVKIPAITFEYSGVPSANYTKNGKTVKINSSVGESYSVTYPYTSHRVYLDGDNVILNFNTTLSNKQIYVYTLRTYPMQVKEAIEKALDGNTTFLKGLLERAYNNTTVNLNDTGKDSLTLYNVPAGDYVVVALENESSEASNTQASNTLIAATAFTVLEHDSTLDVPRTITTGQYLEGYFNISTSSTANYRYIVALVDESVTAKFKLTSDGTKATTNLMLNNAKLVEGFKVAGVGLKNVNASKVVNLLNEAFGDKISVAEDKSGKVYSFRLITEGLPAGKYLLYAAAWNLSNPSQRVVAFNWTEIEITPSIIDRYDTNNNGKIDDDELINGIMDWLDGKISDSEL